MDFLMITSVVLLACTAVYSIVFVVKHKIKEVTLCTSYVDVVLQSNIALILCVFAVLSAFISRRISSEIDSSISVTSIRQN